MIHHIMHWNSSSNSHSWMGTSCCWCAAHHPFIAIWFRCLSNLQLISNVLQKKPHGPRGRRRCAATLASAAAVCDSNPVWQASWTYARELISTQRPTPPQNSVYVCVRACVTPAHTDWDSPRVYSGLGPQRKAETLDFICSKQFWSQVTGTLLCTWTRVLYSSVWRLWLVQRSPRLLSSIFH